MAVIKRCILLASCLLVFSWLRGQSEDKFSVMVSLYQPVSSNEAKILEEIIVSQADFYLRQHLSWNGHQLEFDNTPKKIMSALNQIVKSDVNLQSYESLDDFKEFSDVVKKKIENIQEKSYSFSADRGLSEVQLKDQYLEHQLNELLSIIRTELYVMAEKDMYLASTEIYNDLTKEEKEKLIKEIEEFEDGDLLSPIELTYTEIDPVDNSGGSFGNPEEKDLADKILDLLAENSHRLERLESELSQIQISGTGATSSSSGQNNEIMALLPESMDFYFYSGSSTLTTATLLQLNEIVEILAQAESIKVVITGFADKSGNPSANLALSKRRALAVKRFMEESGMSENRFITNYYGEAKSDTYGNQDRRVEIKFFN